MNTEQVAAALRDVLSSPNVTDSNLEDANVVDVLQRIADAGYAIAHAILPSGTAKGHDATGGTVDSLTEAMMGHTAALEHVASALSDIAEAIREVGSKR